MEIHPRSSSVAAIPRCSTGYLSVDVSMKKSGVKMMENSLVMMKMSLMMVARMMPMIVMMMMMMMPMQYEKLRRRN